MTEEEVWFVSYIEVMKARIKRINHAESILPKEFADKCLSEFREMFRNGNGDGCSGD